MNLVELPPDLVDRCKIHGKGMVFNYSTGVASTKISSHGAQGNVTLQQEAKMGECAFCLWAGVSVEELNWRLGVTDDGYDVLLGRVRVEVKTTGFRSQYLIWPINKNDLYLGKAFDVLVHVKGHEPEFMIYGWIAKGDFYLHHRVAGTDHKLAEGTWHIDELMLHDCADLFLPAPGSTGIDVAQLSIKHRKQDQYIMGRWP